MVLSRSPSWLRCRSPNDRADSRELGQGERGDGGMTLMFYESALRRCRCGKAATVEIRATSGVCYDHCCDRCKKRRIRELTTAHAVEAGTTTVRGAVQGGRMKLYRCDVCGTAVELPGMLNNWHRYKPDSTYDHVFPLIDYCKSCSEQWIKPMSLRSQNEIYDFLAAKRVKAP